MSQGGFDVLSLHCLVTSKPEMVAFREPYRGLYLFVLLCELLRVLIHARQCLLEEIKTAVLFSILLHLLNWLDNGVFIYVTDEASVYAAGGPKEIRLDEIVPHLRDRVISIPGVVIGPAQALCLIVIECEWGFTFQAQLQRDRFL